MTADQTAREARYAEAMAKDWNEQVRAMSKGGELRIALTPLNTMAVADAEQAELRAKVARVEALAAEMGKHKAPSWFVDMARDLRDALSGDYDLTKADCSPAATTGEAHVISPGAFIETGPERWPFGLASAAALVARVAWPMERDSCQAEWSGRLVDEPHIRAATVASARRRFESAIAALNESPAPVSSGEAGPDGGPWGEAAEFGGTVPLSTTDGAT